MIKVALITVHIIHPLNCNLPFEVIYDTSDYTVGAVLGQRKDKKPYLSYYASKTLGEAQQNYTTT